LRGFVGEGPVQPESAGADPERLTDIERRNPNAAQGFLDRVEHIATLLAAFPRMGRPTGEANVHGFPLSPFPYRLFYAVRPGRDEIMILRVRHVSRNH
jgi:plasmid stabilization system protein ParE